MDKKINFLSKAESNQIAPPKSVLAHSKTQIHGWMVSWFELTSLGLIELREGEQIKPPCRNEEGDFSEEFGFFVDLWARLLPKWNLLQPNCDNP